MNKIKKLFNKRSKLLFIITVFELLISTWFLVYFNYLDRLNYIESINTKTKDLALLLENMYTNTFWGLLIIILSLIAIFSLISFIYRDEKFQLISCLLWCIMLVLAINIKDSFINNISTLCIFIPIISLNILSFKNQKNILK